MDRQNGTWLAAGAVLAAFIGLLAFIAADDAQLTRGAFGVALGALVAVLAFLGWSRERRRMAVPPPAAEYLATAFIVGIYLMAVTTGENSKEDLGGLLFIAPPLSFLPLLVRWLLRDDGTPDRYPRRIVAVMHIMLAVGFGLLGMLFVVFGLLILVSPIPLIAAGLHTRAAYVYQLDREGAQSGST